MNSVAKNFYFVGVNGTGKSAIVKGVCGRDSGFVQVRTTHELTTWLGFPDDYDKLRAMDQDEVLRLYGQWVEKFMKNKDPELSYIFESHILNLIKGKVTDRTGDWIKLFDAIVLVEAPADIVLSRIQGDIGKNRAMFPEVFTKSQKKDMLSEFIKLTRQKSEEFAKKIGKPVLTIDNSTDLDSSVAEFLNIARHCEKY